MPIEIFGFIVKPEISIGDIAGIGALIASPLIFWFGYSHTRKSEQIKIARELADRIDAKMQKLNGIQLDEAQTQNGVEIDRRVSEQKTREVLDTIHALYSELEYFIYLLDIHEIRDRNIVKYYLPVPSDGFEAAKRYLEDLAEHGIAMTTPPDLDSEKHRLLKLGDSLYYWEERYSWEKGDRWRRIFTWGFYGKT